MSTFFKGGTNGGGNRFFEKNGKIMVAGEGVQGREDVGGDLARIAEIWGGTVKSNLSGLDNDGDDATFTAQGNGIAKISGAGVGGQMRVQFDTQAEAQKFVEFLIKARDADVLDDLLLGTA